MRKSQKTGIRILFALYLITVLILCFAPFESAPDVPELIWGIPMDKWVHFLMFTPFPVLAYLAFDQYEKTPRQGLGFVAAIYLTGIFLAFATEWGQAHFTETRVGDPLDFAANSIGLTLGSLAVLWIHLRKRK